MSYAYRCDECGKFCKRLRDVFTPGLPQLGVDHEACERCRPDLFEEKK